MTNFAARLLCISVGCTCRPAVSVCPSVTFMYSVETNKRIFKKISPSGSHTILVSGTRRCGINIPTGTP